MNDKNFIEELRQKREEYGVTQRKLAVALEDILQHEGGQGYAGDPSVKGTIINQITGGTKCHDNPPHKYKTENR